MKGLLCALVLASVGVAVGPARADDDAPTRPDDLDERRPYLRVLAQRASVRTGPAASYREIFVASRGEVYEVLDRGTQGYWFRIRLEDGTTGWIFGELVFPFEVGPPERPGVFGRAWRAIRRTLLGPPPIALADVEVSFSAGSLGGDGLFLLRPAWIVDPHLALEASAGLSPRAEKDLFLGTLGLTLRLVPGATVGPYVHVGVGATHVRPKADNFVDEEETLAALQAGGGLEITFKKQIVVRLDARHWTIFDPNQAQRAPEYSGGLAVFF